jgi:hypothetical protein
LPAFQFKIGEIKSQKTLVQQRVQQPGCKLVHIGAAHRVPHA